MNTNKSKSALFTLFKTVMQSSQPTDWNPFMPLVPPLQSSTTLYIYTFRMIINTFLWLFWADKVQLFLLVFPLCVCAFISYQPFKDIYKHRYDHIIQAMHHHICTLYFLSTKNFRPDSWLLFWKYCMHISSRNWHNCWTFVENA